MKQRNSIFKKAWEITTDEHNARLFWYGFIPALLTTIISSLTYSFQGYRYWTEFVVQGDVRSAVLNLFGSFFGYLGANLGMGIILIFLGIIFFLAYYFLPIIFHGGLIKILPKVLDREAVKFRMGLVYGGRYFFKLFEYKTLFSPFKITWVLLTYSILKIFSPELLGPMAIPLIVWFIINVLINLLFVFVEYFIVLKDKLVLDSIRASMKMVFLHMEDVLLMIGLILLMEVRILINVLFLVGIPLLFFFLLSFITNTLLISIGTGFIVILAIALLLFISYLNAHITVFITSAWLLTFMYFQNELPVENETIEPVTS
ncbi:MAG: hypothetical protein ACK4NC_04260 [Candidatus Gracilibacteria bacterium]